MVWLEVAVYLLKVGKSLERGQHRHGSEVKETLHRQEPKGGQVMELFTERRVCREADPGALIFMFRAMGKVGS